MTASHDRNEPRTAPRSPATLAAVLLAACLPGGLGAAPQDETRQVRREVVVVGSHPSEHRLILGQMASRSYLGVQLLTLTPELRRHFGAAENRGVLVSRVEPDSPAATAGVEVGDLITAVDGYPVATAGQLVSRIRQRGEGDRVELDSLRDGAGMTLTATLAQSERREIEVGQFVWQTGREGPLAVDLDPELIERVITVDRDTINDSVSQLLQRLETEGGLPERLRLQSEQRKELEKRIAELEQRLLEMERQLRRRLLEED